MNSRNSGFGSIATALARNPLGIIALFIVLVYGFATLVTTLGSSFSEAERLPLIYFLVGFPVLVLGVFAWLVSSHSGKLFAPADFRDEENYVRMQLSAVASLAAASATRDAEGPPTAIEPIVEAVQTAALSGRERTGRGTPSILWVDDNPSNNTYAANAFEAVGIRVEVALSTREALEKLESRPFDAIISDMGRREGPREGYILLDALRSRGDQTPFYIHAGSSLPEHVREAREHGAQGCTGDAQALFTMVARTVFGRSTKEA